MSQNLFLAPDKMPDSTITLPAAKFHTDIFLNHDHLAQLLDEDAPTLQYMHTSRLPLYNLPGYNESLIGLQLVKEFTES